MVWLAIVGVAALVVISLWEVVLRYLFNHPTMWAYDVSSYLLCFCSMAALPKVVESGSSISITLLIEALGEKLADFMRGAIEVVAGTTCIFVSVVAAFIAAEQYADGNVTVAAVAIPKWWLTLIVCYGFGLSGVMHFLRCKAP